MKNQKENAIEELVVIANKQNNKINLSTILITTKCEPEHVSDVINQLTYQGIDVVTDDVEPDVDDINEEGEIDRKVSPFDPSKIDIKMDKITIDSIIKRIKNDELEFDSSFQRKVGLWSRKQKSQLIESILLKIPLPAFYFDASNDDKWQIIDGLQRIGTIREYVVEKSFVLGGLEFLRDLEGLNFDELPRSMQRRIEETNLNAYLVNPSTPKNVKFNIFKRINTGGLILEPQEIRNALYQGQATEFLQELSKTDAFIKATDYSIKTDRMLDREFCLRYIAFVCMDYDEYNGNMDEYQNKCTKRELNEIKEHFEYVMNNCREIFGKQAFRRMNTSERRGPVNKALFEAWSMIISDMDSDRIQILIKKRKSLQDDFTKLCNEYDFQNALRASDKNSVKTRIEGIRTIVYKETN